MIICALSQFNDRQVSRMALVGVTEGNKPVIEQSFHRILAAFNAGIVESTFMFGTRPSLADFGWFGQLWTLSMDPTSSLEMRGRAPRVLPWLLRLEDASGVDGAWRTEAEGVSGWVRAMLALAEETYLPFLRANARAIEKGHDTVSLSLPGGTYSQAPFKYQAKCYAQPSRTSLRLCSLRRVRLLIHCSKRRGVSSILPESASATSPGPDHR